MKAEFWTESLTPAPAPPMSWLTTFTWTVKTVPDLPSAVRAAAVARLQMAVNDQTASYKCAQAHGLGQQESAENTVMVDGVAWQWQEWAKGFTYWPKANWNDMRWFHK